MLISPFISFHFCFLHLICGSDATIEPSIRYLNERRLNGNEGQSTSASTAGKRPSAELGQLDGQPSSGKRPRGRPKGSKNRAKAAASGDLVVETGGVSGLMM